MNLGYFWGNFRIIIDICLRLIQSGQCIKNCYFSNKKNNSHEYVKLALFNGMKMKYQRRMNFPLQHNKSFVKI